MGKKHWFYCLLSLLISFANNELTGQVQISTNNLPLYQDGKLYLKIKSNSNTIVYKRDSITNDINGQVKMLFNKYNVTKTEQPFAILNDAKLNKTYRITYASTLNVENFIAELQQISTVEYAEKVPAMYTTAVPNDPMQPYHLPLVNANLASNIHISIGNAIVAIVDDAVLITHEDLAANVGAFNRDVADLDNDPNPPLSGSNAVTNTHFTHGTHVSGIAGAVTNNGVGVASIGWNNKLMCVKIKADSDVGNNLPFAFDGLSWAAANGAHVINMSWGGFAPSETEYNIVVAAKNNNIVLVAAAGNDASGNAFYPAAYGEGLTGQAWEIVDKKLVVAVAAIDVNNDISIWPGGIIGANGSNYGNWVDISAYGTDILSTLANSSFGNPINNQYGTSNGTSMAAPIVSGIAGIMRSFNMAKTADEIIDCLFYTANSDIYNSLTNPSNVVGTLGTGRVDADAALRCLGVDCSNNPIAIIAPSSQYLCPGDNITLTANQGQSYLWSNGATTQTINITNTGTYSVVITFAGGCTATTNITINAAPTEASISVFEQTGLNPNDGIMCGFSYVNVLSSYGLSYEWDVTGGATSQGITGITAGNSYPFTANICVKVNGVSGCIGVNSTACVTLSWLTPPTVDATANPTQVCPGEPITLTATGADSYIWNPGALSGNIVVVYPTLITNYTVIGSDINGCTNIATVSVNENMAPFTVNASLNNICIGQSTTLSASGSVSYIWQPGNLSGSDITVSPSSNTIYTVTGTDVNGCVRTATINIGIRSSPIISVNASNNPVCPGDYITLTANGGNSYLWQPGNISGYSGIVVNPYSNTTYTVTGTDYYGCSNFATITLTIPPIPPINVVASPNTICLGQSTILSATGGSGYLWVPGYYGGNNISFNPSSNTIYTVTGTVANGCTNSATVGVTVNSFPPPTISATANPTQVCPGEPITLTATGANSYIWDPGALSGNSIIVNPTASTTYVVTGTDANGCSGTNQVTVNVNTINYDYPNGINITSTSQIVSDLNSDGKIMIKGPVYVNANYTITNKTWYFGNDYTLDQTGDLGIPSSGVVVLPGITLTMDNTIFTAASNCEMWNGMQVLGKPAVSYSQSSPTARISGPSSNVSSPAVIGKLIMKNASIIQYARVGVSCFESTIPFTRTYTEFGAGVLQAYGNSKFINNYIGVSFKGYTLLTNNSYINDCEFICTAPLPDEGLAGKGTLTFVNLSSIKGPNFRGNSFTNSYSGFGEDKRGAAFRSVNSGYNVIPLGAVGNTFNNLTNGINTFATGGLKNINVSGNTFNNVQQAITTVGTNYDNITGNTFNIPDQTLSTLPTWGVYLNGTNGFNVSTGNTFNKCAGCTGSNSKGVIVIDGGTFGGNISKNNFNDLQVATQSEGNNGSASGGMQLKCNTYTSNQYAISVSPQYPTMGSLAPQGVGCANGQDRPANKFPDACTGTGNYKDINSTIAITYFENTSNVNLASPTCVNTGFVTLSNCTGIPSDDCNAVARCTNLGCLQTLQHKMENQPDLLEKKQLLNEIIIGHLLSNANSPETVIKNILEAWNTDHTRKLLVPIYIEERDFVKARNTLDQIPQNTTEEINYHRLYDVMITLGQDRKTINEMSPVQEQTIRDVANSSTLIKYHAQSVLEGSNKEHFTRIPEEIQLSTARLANPNNENLVTALYDASKPLLLSNYPNPFNENTVIPYYLPDDAIAGVLSITDITGRIIQTYNLDKGVNKIEFNTDDLHNGIYYYNMMVDGKLISCKKMTLIK